MIFFIRASNVNVDFPLPGEIICKILQGVRHSFNYVEILCINL